MMENSRILFQAEVLDNKDPMMLGRVRAKLTSTPITMGDGSSDIINSIKAPIWNQEKDIWTSRDPFVFQPLIPYFMYQVPKKGEFILIVYLNKDFTGQNQYYVQSNFSSPTATFGEYIEGGNTFTSIGNQYVPPRPLKNLDGTYTDSAHKGVFPEPGDNALLGRGSSDVIIKENEVLVRAGKYINTQLQPNIVPTSNPKRGFLQISNFSSSKNRGKDKVITQINERVVPVNYLIEWTIVNPENKLDLFTGAVYLYKLKQDITTNSKNLTVGSIVNENLKSLIATENFRSLSKSETITFINNFIQTCNKSNRTKTGITLFTTPTDKFPMFYRPTNKINSQLTLTNPSDPITLDSTINLIDMFNQIKLIPSLKQGGYGLIYAQDKVGTPLNFKSTNVIQTTYSNEPTTYGALGSDYLFLLSHNSQIPGKGKINFNDTLYGISLDKFVDEILPKTSSLVRGEELLDLINLIVRFLLTHTHAYPGLAPVSITQDGSNVQDILTELQNASTKILNRNIRLN